MNRTDQPDFTHLLNGELTIRTDVFGERKHYDEIVPTVIRFDEEEAPNPHRLHCFGTNSRHLATVEVNKVGARYGCTYTYFPDDSDETATWDWIEDRDTWVLSANYYFCDWLTDGPDTVVYVEWVPDVQGDLGWSMPVVRTGKHLREVV